MNSSLLLAFGAPPLVEVFAITVAATALFGYLAQRLGLVSIVGYLVAGVVVGPLALGLIDDLELIDQLAEIGVIFLMFFIGLELSGDLLKSMGRLMFLGGALQVGLTIGLVTAIALAFGVGLNSAIYTGCLVALSSTAVVLKLLSNKDETSSPVGQVSVAFLIFQDITIVLLVLVVPMLGDGGGGVGDVVSALLKAFFVIVMTIVVAKWAIPFVLDAVAEYTDGEEFLLVVLAVSGGVAYVVTLFGVTASLGAFVAGLVVAAGPHRERATEYIVPFQAVFAALFFASIGMLLDPDVLLHLWVVIVFYSVVVVAVKFVGVAAAARLLKRPLPIAAASGLVLAQVGEFAFVLEGIGSDAGLSPAGRGEEGSQIFNAVAVILISITPVLYSAGGRVRDALLVKGQARESLMS